MHCLFPIKPYTVTEVYEKIISQNFFPYVLFELIVKHKNKRRAGLSIENPAFCICEKTKAHIS